MKARAFVEYQAWNDKLDRVLVFRRHEAQLVGRERFLGQQSAVFTLAALERERRHGVSAVEELGMIAHLESQSHGTLLRVCCTNLAQLHDNVHERAVGGVAVDGS